MRKFFVAVITVILIAAPATATELRILGEDESGITLEFIPSGPVIDNIAMTGSGQLSRITIPRMDNIRIDGLPTLPVRRFFIEVPAEGGIRLQVLDASSRVLGGIVPAVWFREEAGLEGQLKALSASQPAGRTSHAVLAESGVMRGRRLAIVDFYPVVWDAAASSLVYSESIVVRLSFPPAEGSRGKIRRRAGGGDYLLYDAAETGILPGRSDNLPAARTPFEFSMSDRWLKLGIASTGIHAVSYVDLLNAGINPLTIDPSTVRVFTAGPLQQPDLIDDGGSFQEDYHLTEVAVLYEGDDPDVFSTSGRLIFYAAGSKGWKNVLDPAAGWTEWYEHDYSDESVYWMSWGGEFPGTPARIPSREVTPSAAAPDLELTTYEERTRYEQDNLFDPRYTDDRWYWRLLGVSSSSHTERFYINGIEGSSGRVRTIGYGPYQFDYNFPVNEAIYSINGEEAGTLNWQVLARTFRPETLDVYVDNLIDGTNTFRVSRGEDSKVYLLWYEIYYERALTALSGRLDFLSPDQGTAATALFSMNGFTPGYKVYLLDVTDFENPVGLTGFTGGTTGSVGFEDVLAGGRTHYSACSSNMLIRPSIEIPHASSGGLVSLRDEPDGPDMVIIHPEEFRDAATLLASYRSGNLPGVEAPLVEAVSLEQVFDNFSGGMRDPVAIRNYLKFLYDTYAEGVEPDLRYALLMGNGTYDTRDILGTGNDKLPLYMKIYVLDVVEDDHYFARLDAGDDRLIDLSIGRMTVLTAEEATRWVNSIIDYESGEDQGTWRDRILLVADDEFSASGDCDFGFTVDTEEMVTSKALLPGFFDINKIYLHEYPFVGDLKPGATSDLLAQWNAGALIINYTGHGSPQQMADERVMQKSDVYSLRNENRKPLFLAFSCSVGDIESPYQRSISQELLVRESGGAIATITGTGGTFGPQNELLSNSLVDKLFTSYDSTGTIPVGTALMLAQPCCTSFQENSSKYLLLGDPALTLAVPRYVVEYDATTIDTLFTGTRYRIEGRITSGGTTLDTFNGSADILVQESQEHVVDGPFNCYTLIGKLVYDLPGKAIFRGTVDVTGGAFSADFVVPLRCRAGSTARIRSYLSGTGLVDAAGAVDSITIINNPNTVENEGPPVISIFFAGQANKVKQGSILNVEISDPDGIAILGTDPQSSIFLEFDNSGYPIFVTEYFSYDHGSYTTGRVEYPLHSGFSPGPHSVIVRAFDNLGESSTDTLSFDVVEEGLYTVSDVFNMPNPFTESTDFIFQLSNEADVVLRVYNVSGREIWHKKMYADEGFNSIYWDGRDYGGDRPANGTYLYILDVSFRNSFNRSEKVKGKAVLLK